MASSRRLLGFVAMTLVALVVAHNLVFLLAHGAGYDEALAHSGHGRAWTISVAVVLAAGFGLVGLALWRLHRLGLVARTIDATEGRLPPGRGRFVPRLARHWLGLAGATMLLFVIQENLEHQHVGAGLPGLSVLGSAEYPNAVPVIAGIALAVAFVGSLFRWRREVLIDRIVTALRRRRLRLVRPLRRPIADRDSRPESLVGRGLAVRAPPLLLAR
jgi:hypothetical protein